jgi:NADPH-dependent curcumin reductase CurA
MERWRKIILTKRPVGMPVETDFRIDESALSAPGDNEFLARVTHLSVDPYMRGRMREAASYAQPVALGEVMTGAGVARVIESRSARFAVGDYVTAITGWQTHFLSDGRGVRKLDPAVAPVSTALGVLGMPGLTAYFGVLDVGQAKPGETVLISGAAGAVGSIAGQIAKVQGCRVVGAAGSDDKVQWLTGELGFDAAFNYKTVSGYRERLAELCPNGIDVYFDNTGGPLSDAALAQLNLRGRIAVCGQISQYNEEKALPGPRLDFHLIIKRARKEGFLVTDYVPRFDEGRAALTAWLREGRLRYREQVEHGFENTVRAFIAMMEGRNIGKMLVEVSGE